ncbi:AraC family transcriptional regulator [Paenibacillus sp. HB172176]|uniref:AraC family transcriptional regulator n=1 Tax=Paenibacillus sp. HB172176 TaxID=2493690 RepID=UPI001F109EFB|nr:AraC family transcriptional regulator [Paenibacillus sp. HB172176]
MSESIISADDPSASELSLDGLWFKFRSIRLLRHDGFQPQLLQAHALILANQGEGTITIHLDTHRLHGDAVRFIEPGQTIAFSEKKGEGLEVYLLLFDLHRDEGVSKEAALPSEIDIYGDHALHQLCESLMECSRSEHMIERFKGQSLFLELLTWILLHRRHCAANDSRTALDRTLSYIGANYKEVITIEQLARMAEISPKYYVSLFKKTYGKTAMDYVKEVRVNRAKRLMLQEGALLRDVAYQVGYHDEFYFSRIFKKEVGVSPMAYMKNRKQKIVAYSASVLGQLLALHMMPYAAPIHPKWTSYYYANYRHDIPLHLSCYRFNLDWETNIDALEESEEPLDCIIATDQLQPPERDRLSQLSELHVVPLYSMCWREQLRAIAEIVHASEEASTWLERYDRRLCLVRERIHERLREETVLIVSLYQDQLYLFPSSGMRDMFEELQLQRPVGSETYGANQSVTPEELAALDADHLLFNIRQESVTLHYWEELRTKEVWQDMKAVRRNHVHAISSDPWREYSAYAMERMLEQAYERLYDNRT